MQFLHIKGPWVINWAFRMCNLLCLTSRFWHFSLGQPTENDTKYWLGSDYNFQGTKTQFCEVENLNICMHEMSTCIDDIWIQRRLILRILMGSCHCFGSISNYWARPFQRDLDSLIQPAELPMWDSAILENDDICIVSNCATTISEVIKYWANQEAK